MATPPTPTHLGCDAGLLDTSFNRDGGEIDDRSHRDDVAIGGTECDSHLDADEAPSGVRAADHGCSRWTERRNGWWSKRIALREGITESYLPLTSSLPKLEVASC